MRHLLTAALLLIPATAEPQDWPISSAAAEQLKSAPLDSLAARARRGDFGHTDNLFIVRNGRVVRDERFGLDYRVISRGKKSFIGCGIDACTASTELHQYNYLHPDFHPFFRGTDQHTLQSVTKSVTATLFGIALRRGEIDSLRQPLLAALGEYARVATDPRLAAATLADLLTMRTGIEWHEGDRPLDGTNTTVQLEGAPDWIRFTLSQPMDATPGTKWTYNSGGSALMAEVIRGATGLHVDAYAERELFTPLGISHQWKKTPTGHPDTEGGLYLSAPDLAKIGQLYLDDGVWRGQRILPPGWAREATHRHVDHVNSSPASPGYGYQWWRYDRRGFDVWAGNGFGGQFLVIIPQLRMVAVTNAWNVFGNRAAPILVPLIDALLDAASAPVTAPPP